MKNMHVRFSVFFSMCLLIVAVLSSCKFGSIISKDDDSSPGSKVVVTLSASRTGSSISTVARTVTVSSVPSVNSYELWGGLTGNDQTKLAAFSTLDSASVSLDAGTWNFTLKALNSDNMEFLEGTKSGVSVSGRAVSLAFVLAPLSSGTGSVSVSLSWASSGKNVADVVTSFAGETLDPALAISSSGVTFEKTGVSAGAYLLTFQLYANSGDGSPSSTVSEMVRIYPNMTSSKSLVLSASDFNSPPAAPSGVSVTPLSTTSSSTASVTVSWNDNSENEEGFTVYYGETGTDESGWSSVSSSAATTSATVTDLTRGKSYSFKVAAYNSFGTTYAATTASHTPSNSLYQVTFKISEEATNIAESRYAESGSVIGTLPNDPGVFAGTFVGWYTRIGGKRIDIAPDTVISADMTAYAKRAVTVFFDGNGGSGSMDPMTFSLGFAGTIPANQFTRSDYVFEGWSTGPTTAVFLDGVFTPAETWSASDGDYNLYAIWRYTGATYSSMAEGSTNYLSMVSMSAKASTSADGYLLGHDGKAYMQTSFMDGSSVTATFENDITPFKIGAYEVTYELWHTVQTWALAHGYSFENTGTYAPYSTDNPNVGAEPTSATSHMPVTYINWRDAIVWCNAYTEWYNANASPATSLACVYCADAAYSTPLRDSTAQTWGGDFATLRVTATKAGSIDDPYVNPNAKGFRLPTEGENQYAASCAGFYAYTQVSGQTSGKYTDTSASTYAKYKSIIACIVGSKNANVFGLYDMSGNAAEWCFDWYRSNYTGASTTSANYNYVHPYDSSATPYRVHRGGSYDSGMSSITSYSQIQVGQNSAAYPYDNCPPSRPDKAWSIGFRVCQTE